MIRDRIREIVSQHMYEVECSLWNCNCGVSFGPPMVEGVDWEHHIADVLATELGLDVLRHTS